MKLDLSLSEFAKRRLRLASLGLPSSASLFDDDSPWFVAIDQLEQTAAAAGKSLVSFGNYDYLGLGKDPRITKAAIDAAAQLGVGAGASRLIGGERALHRALEADIAGFVGSEAAIAIVSGYLMNLSLIPHLVAAGDLVVVDELMHNSSLQGAKASRATLRTFRHNDLDHLEEILKSQRDQHASCLIVAEGIYSMDGDLVDLPRLLSLRDQYSAWVMIDEAHSIGVLGATGRGICEHYGVDPNRVDVLMGTLSKTFVSMGGFVCARQSVIDFLKFTLPGFVFSVGLSPVIAASAKAALAILRQEPNRVRQLQEMSRYFLDAAKAAGLNTGYAMGYGIIPILFHDPAITLMASHALANESIYAPPIMQVGLKADESRIRFFITAGHQRAQIDRAIHVVKSVLRDSGADKPLSVEGPIYAGGEKKFADMAASPKPAGLSALFGR